MSITAGNTLFNRAFVADVLATAVGFPMIVALQRTFWPLHTAK
jgi:hypothetical protein